MRVKLDTSGWKQAEWHEYVVRFIFGGLITAIVGLIGKKYGPVIAGLFLAFPAIFPASATLVEQHEKKKKRSHGMKGTVRGRKAASVDAAGAAMGSVGLLVFALLIWRFLPGSNHALLLSLATVAWLSVSVLLWRLRKRA